MCGFFILSLCYNRIYMQHIIDIIQVWIGSYGFLGVIGAGIVEELISPIPSSLVQGFAGAVLFSGAPFTLSNIASFFLTVPLGSAIGVTVGSLPYLWFSRTIGLTIIDKYGTKIGVTHNDMEKLTKKMSATKWDEWLFVGLRAFPLIPNVALAIYGGITKMPLGKYVILSMIGIFIRGTIVGGLGWFAGNVLSDFSNISNALEKFGLVSLVIIMVGLFIWNKQRKKKVDKSTQSE